MELKVKAQKLEELEQQKHAARERTLQVEVEEAKAALAEEAAARAREWAESSSLQEQLEDMREEKARTRLQS